MMQAGMNLVVPQTCGVGILGLFRDVKTPIDSRRLTKLKPVGGAGWAIASFTDAPEHAEEYAKAERMLKKRFKVVYSSPKRVNRRTGHTFWFHIYDTKEV